MKMALVLLVFCSLCLFHPGLGQKVRLVNGVRPSSGLLNIQINGEWGTVCDDFFQNAEAIVVCRQLGYTDPTQAYADYNVAYDSSMDMVLDDLQCTGSEKNLLECPHAGIGVHDCYVSEQVGVHCAAPGGTGCLEDPPCEKPAWKCPFNNTEVVQVPHRICPICRCASCPEEPKCPDIDTCKSGELQYYDGLYCRRCKCLPQNLPDKIIEPNSISVALLVAVCVVALGIPLVCLAIVLVIKKKLNAPTSKGRQAKKETAPVVVDNWFGAQEEGGHPSQPRWSSPSAKRL